MLNIPVGTRVKAIFVTRNGGVANESVGEVVGVGGPLGQPSDHNIEVLWEDGTSFSMNSMFFLKTMKIVERMPA